MTTAIAALAHLAPEFFETLSPLERLALPYMPDLWLRPDQQIPDHDWSTYGEIAGRGKGKTYGIAAFLTGCVQRGEARMIALMAPNDERVEEVQIRALVDASPPWFKAERYAGGVVWPDGSRAFPFTAEMPERPRGSNFAMSWCTELVDWPANTRRAAWDNMVTVTRAIGTRQQVLYDTTSKGKNQVILDRIADSARDPRAHVLRRGTSFDNPLLSRKALRALCALYPEGSRRWREEIEGEVLAESAGASWHQAWLDDHRRHVPPANPDLVLVAIDPAKSARPEADLTGISVGARDAAGDAYLLEDLSGRHTPEQWGDLAVGACVRYGAAGIVIELSGSGTALTAVVRSRAEKRDLAVRLLPKGQPFPRHTPGVIYVREVFATQGKHDRAAGPASETERGRVHIVGHLPELELEMTTFEPGQSQSPNRLDAAAYVITELRGLNRDAPADVRVDSAEALAAHRELSLRLRGGRGRRF